MPINFHEDLGRAERARGSSDRTFGLVFALFFLLLGLAPLRHESHVRLWWLVAAALTLAVALVRPQALHGANRLWMGLGRVLGRIVNPVALTIMFYLVITPTALLLRMLGKTPLRLKWDQSVDSYWIPRPAGGNTSESESMSRQF